MKNKVTFQGTHYSAYRRSIYSQDSATLTKIRYLVAGRAPPMASCREIHAVLQVLL